MPGIKKREEREEETRKGKTIEEKRTNEKRIEKPEMKNKSRKTGRRGKEKKRHLAHQPTYGGVSGLLSIQ